MTDRADTRRRLVEMREQLLDSLGGRIDGGTLAMLAGVTGALAALDAGEPVDAEPMVRAIVTLAPGLPITLAIYAEDGRAVAVELEPIRALTIANELIAAAVAGL